MALWSDDPMEQPETFPTQDKPVLEQTTTHVSIPGILAALAVGLPALLSALNGTGLTPVQSAWLVAALAFAAGLANLGSITARNGGFKNAMCAVLKLFGKEPR